MSLRNLERERKIIERLTKRDNEKEVEKYLKREIKKRGKEE